MRYFVFSKHRWKVGGGRIYARGAYILKFSCSHIFAVCHFKFVAGIFEIWNSGWQFIVNARQNFVNLCAREAPDKILPLTSMHQLHHTVKFLRFEKSEKQ